MEVHQFNLTVKIFNQRRAAFHPIAGIQINDVANVPDFRAMDVAANHALDILFPRRLHDRVFVIAHIFDRRLGFVFQISGERPIPETEPAPDAIEMEIKVQNPIVKPGADAVEQTVEIHDPIELVTVQN